MKKMTWIWLAIAVAAIILIWYFFIRETEVEAAANVMQNETQRRMSSFTKPFVPTKVVPFTDKYNCDGHLETGANGNTYCVGTLQPV